MKIFLPFAPEKLADVPAECDVEVFDGSGELPAGADDVEFYVPGYTFSGSVTRVLASMPRLKVVQTLTAGTDHIQRLIPTGVTLCNARGVHDTATSELALGMMISAERRLADLVRAQDRHEWDTQMASSLADRRVLVVGAGSIARSIEVRLRACECEVTLVGRTARDDIRAVADLPLLLPDADIVVLIAPLTEETRGLVDREFLAQLSDGALLVNVARGGIVVTDDLVAELSTGRLRAALDVTDPEPLPPDHPLWTTPGTIITPHVGGASSAMWPRAYALVQDQLFRFVTGQPLRNIVE